MSNKTLNIEMGNLICRFGNKKLLGLAEEIVIPAFTDEGMTRTHSKTTYFFHQVEFVKLHNRNHEAYIGIAGRYIKDTMLQREQIFQRGKGLIKDSDSMRSSPSAIFLLILNNHRLLYVKETRNAPDKESFKSTLLSFLKSKHKDYIDKEYDRYKLIHDKDNDQPRVTKVELLNDTPRPTLQLIPLTSKTNIEEFIKKYDILKKVEISFSDRNDEMDNNPFFHDLQQKQDLIGSNKSILTHINNTDGLNKIEAINEIAEATSQGNQFVKLTGTDGSGDKLTGNNKEFQLRKPIDDLSATPKKAGKEIFNSYNEVVDEGLIKVPSTRSNTINIINSLINKYIS